MNTLCICAQDIKWVEFAWVRDGALQDYAKHDGAPETYLNGLDTVINQWGKALSDIDRLFVVTGPGSFTASRVSVTMANTLAFVQNVPVAGADNPKHHSLKDLLDNIDLSAFDFKDGKETPVIPVYDRPPGITQPKK